MMEKTTNIDVLTSDIETLEDLLRRGHTTSRYLIESYLAQIEKHDGYLHAMIQTTPKELLCERADTLDKGRQAGEQCSPLYSIPIIVKVTSEEHGVSDAVADHFRIHLPPIHLSGWEPRPAVCHSWDPNLEKNSKVVEMLLAAGAIILGKANLSRIHDAEWLVCSRQTNAFRSPAGSSSGSAVAVSAGYAPVSIGTETDGSLIGPAGRAALYTIKPTIGLVSQAGIVPVSSHFDSAGPMTKSVYDLAVLLDVISEKEADISFTSSLSGPWSEISVGTLDPLIWKFPDTIIKPVPMASEQILEDITNAYEVIKSKAKRFVTNVPLPSTEGFNLDGISSEMFVTRADLKRNLNAYLQDLKDSQVRSLQDIMDFNKEHAAEELPPYHPRQDEFEKAQEQETLAEEYDSHLTHLRRAAAVDGIDCILDEYGIDVIIGPADSFMSSYATGSGYPIAAMPLSYLRFNGRPLGVAAIARKNQEHLLIKVMSAWEATFLPRQPPDLTT